MATAIMNTLGGKLIISEDKRGTVCWTDKILIGFYLHIRIKIRDQSYPSTRWPSQTCAHFTSDFIQM